MGTGMKDNRGMNIIKKYINSITVMCKNQAYRQYFT